MFGDRRVSLQIGALSVLLGASAAMAQPEGPGGPDRPPPRERGEFGRFGGRVRESYESILKELKLSDEQKADVMELIERYESAERERRSRQMDDRGRELFEEMRAARESGDEARIEEAQKKLQEWRTDPARRQAMESSRQAREDLNKEIAERLTEEQRKRFEQWVAEQRNRIGGVQVGADLLRQALKDLKLTDEQKHKIDDLFAAYDKAVEKVERRDFQARADLTRKLNSDVMKLLTRQQQEEFTQAMRRVGESQRRGPGRDGARPRRPRPNDGGDEF